MSKIKNARANFSETVISTVLLPVVNGKPLLCGKLPHNENKSGKSYKYYQIAHIYPRNQRLLRAVDQPKRNTLTLGDA